MSGHTEPRDDYEFEPWYKYGVAFLFFEAAIAVAVSIYALYMAFTGQAVEFKKKVTFDKPQSAIESQVEGNRQEADHSTITVPSDSK